MRDVHEITSVHAPNLRKGSFNIKYKIIFDFIRMVGIIKNLIIKK